MNKLIKLKLSKLLSNASIFLNIYIYIYINIYMNTQTKLLLKLKHSNTHYICMFE